MKIFKPIQATDVVKNYNKKDLTPLFGEDAIIFKDAGWTSVESSDFVESPSIKSNARFVNGGQFSVSYVDENNPLDFEEYLSWNSVMGAIGVPYNSELSRYEYVVEGDRITKAIVISLNQDEFKEKMDFDNFFIALSNQTGDTSVAIGGTNFNLANFLPLAPYYLKNKKNLLSSDSDLPIQSYELRSSDDNTFLTINTADDSISIDWTQGNISGIQGEFFPSLGIVVLFPEKFTDQDIATTIDGAGDRTVASLNTIMYMGGYGIKASSNEVIFLRLFNREFNQSSNPSAFRNLGGKMEYLNRLIDDEVTYPTKIGLFNDQNECLVVVSLNKAEKKSRETELPIRVEIDI